MRCSLRSRSFVSFSPPWARRVQSPTSAQITSVLPERDPSLNNYSAGTKRPVTSEGTTKGGDTTNDYGDYGGGGSGGSEGGSGGDGDGWDGDGGSGECMVNYGGGGTRRRDGSDATGSDDERGAGGSSAARKSPCPAG